MSRFSSSTVTAAEFAAAVPQPCIVPHSVHSYVAAAWSIRQATLVVRRTLQSGRATAPACRRCGQELRVFKVRGITREGTRFRVHWRCTACGNRWAQYVLVTQQGRQVSADLFCSLEELPPWGPASTP